MSRAKAAQSSSSSSHCVSPTTAQRHAVQPLVVRLEHGEHPVHCSPSRRQLQLLDHPREVPDLLDKRVRQHQPGGYAKPGHDCTNSSRKLGEVFNVRLLGLLLRLALGIPGLSQLDCDLLSSHLRLLKLDSSL
jgi:hypothetical protein